MDSAASEGEYHFDSLHTNAMAPAKSKAPKEEQPAEDSAIESAEREMLTRELMIKSLEKKLIRTEASLSGVTAENKQLKLSLEEAQETLRDVSDHLKRELSSKVLGAAALCL